ncbi:hypothetical protein I3760_04G079300 [Carya illinoinensis]|nr:hypothetical protein I3760_04G079300 [Carya illinoinensis]
MNSESSASRGRVKGKGLSWKADIVCLQETKLKLIDRKLVRSLWRGSHVDWSFLASNGASGGVVVMWDRRVVEKVEDCIGQYSVACSFKCVSDNFLWAFVGVYGPNLDSTRKLMWEELAGVHSWWGLPWCIGGDFNVVRFPSEVSGTRRLRPAMEDFSEFVFDLNLVDLPLAGASRLGQIVSPGQGWIGS